ncbi:MAG: alpha/beta hydrolase [Deltaproteobacteria bacterium]|nr:alpha/beta hydrolase [Deltaproteobacteria bacterium]
MKETAKNRTTVAALLFVLLVAVLIAAMALASAVQRDFGRVAVSNVRYLNGNGIPIRAKLMHPKTGGGTRFPGIVYIHGYQNNRETGDAYCIELARRGFVVLNIDAIGRGNSGIPGNPADPGFDDTYGGQSSLDYLRSLPLVDPGAVGMMGHSLGAEMAYKVALRDPGVRGLVITGFAYTTAADYQHPANMLMIIGKYDEYRKRMTGTRNILTDWMKSEQTRKVIDAPNPEIGVTYGDFSAGTARRVFVPHVTHIQESHNRDAIAEALLWMRQALNPPAAYWSDPHRQIWPVKEWATLVAMVAGFFSLLPLSTLLLRLAWFRPLAGAPTATYACGGKAFLKHVTINGLVMWLYLPLIFILFGIHIYLVPIDRVFPMMMVNAIVWWFLCINIIGFFIFRRWFKKQNRLYGTTLADMGISFKKDLFYLDGVRLGKGVALAMTLFIFAYAAEHLLESIFIVDYRFIFPFASDLTPYRLKMWLVYFPFLLIGFLQTGVFLHGQIRKAPKRSQTGTFLAWSGANLAAMIVPLLLFLCIQYIPLLTTGFIPLVGPGGMFVSFVLNLFHLIVVLCLVIPISTWLFQVTGTIYTGAVLNAALVTWMFTSSQVIAPIPI